MRSRATLPKHDAPFQNSIPKSERLSEQIYRSPDRQPRKTIKIRLPDSPGYRRLKQLENDQYHEVHTISPEAYKFHLIQSDLQRQRVQSPQRQLVSTTSSLRTLRETSPARKQSANRSPVR